MYGHFMQGRRRVTFSNRTVRRAVSMVALVAFLGALFSIRVIPVVSSFYSIAAPKDSHADSTTTVAQKLSAGGTDASKECSSVTLLMPQPSFSPIRLKEAALEEYRQRQHSDDAGGANSVQVDAADLRRAEENVVRMLPRFVTKDDAGSDAPLRCPVLTSGASLFNTFRNFLQERALDARPIVLDFGCSIGVSMATVHSNSTVICVFDDERLLGKKELHETPDAVEDIRREPHRRPPNLLWLEAHKGSGGFLQEPFSQLYDACNFVTMGLALFLLQQPLRKADDGRAGRNDMVVALLQKMLPTTAVILAALHVKSPGTDPAAQLGRYNVEVGELCAVLRSDLVDAAKRSSVVYACDVIAVVPRSPSATLGVVRLVLGTSTRPCRKTWGAPLIQWDRSQTVQFSNGAVTFRVDLVSKSGGANDGDKPKSKTTMRTIHPLQYIHSLNLDTLLGAGLAVPLRQQILGKMIASPRYSDPLPHNWVVSGGGVIERIDKIDLRYDKDVDENKGYWGHSTRGYLHLFAEHLCLRVAPNGLPSVAEDDPTCRRLCRQCARECSYLPKATQPCRVCVECSECIQTQSYQASNHAVSASASEKDGSLHCQKKYSSMHAARNVWKSWERADRKHFID
jgi:hypothetical protein